MTARTSSSQNTARGVLIALLALLLLLAVAGCQSLVRCPGRQPRAVWPQYPTPRPSVPPTFTPPTYAPPTAPPHVQIPAPPPAAAEVAPDPPRVDPGRVDRLEQAVGVIAETLGQQQDRLAQAQQDLEQTTQPKHAGEPAGSGQRSPTVEATPPPPAPTTDAAASSSSRADRVADAAATATETIGGWGLTAIIGAATGGGGLLAAAGMALGRLLLRRGARRIRARVHDRVEQRHQVEQVQVDHQQQAQPAEPVPTSSSSSATKLSPLCALAGLVGKAESNQEELPVIAEPVRQSRTVYVQTPTTDGLAEDQEEAMRRLVELNPKLRPFAEQWRQVSGQLQDGRRAATGANGEQRQPKPGWKND